MSSSATSTTSQENEVVHRKTDNNNNVDGDINNSTPTNRSSKKKDDNVPLPSSVAVDHSKDMSACLSPLQYESNSSAPTTSKNEISIDSQQISNGEPYTLNKGIDIDSQQLDVKVSSTQKHETTNMNDSNDSASHAAAHTTDNRTHYNASGNPTPDLPSSSSNSNSSWSVLSDKQRPVVRSITFNRDRTCLILSTNFGVRVRTLESLHISLQNLNVNDNEEEGSNSNNSNWIHDVALPPDGSTYAQILHNTSLLAVVKPKSPRCCQLFNAKHSLSPIAILPLSAAVKRVEIQRKVLVAMTVDLRLHIFHMSDDGGIYGRALKPTLVTTLNIFHPSDSARNIRGLEGYNAGSYFDLNPNEDEPYLVCKSFNGTPGTVRVYNPTVVQTLPNVSSCSASLGSGRSATSTASSWDRHDNANHPITKKTKRRLQLLTTINAHDHSVTRMLIGGGGKGKTSLCCTSYLATVSSKGTTIRLFGLPKGDYLWEWHRGKRACQFYSISWGGSESDRLASYGSSGTIHIFDWGKKKEPKVTKPENIDDEDDVDNDFKKVHDDDNDGPRKLVLDSTTSTKPKPLLRRLSSPITHRITGKTKKAPTSPPKHRSYTKLKYKPSASAVAGSNTKSQTLVVAMLDRDESCSVDDSDIKEDRLVLCTIDGELRQYSVKKNVELTQVEDVLK